MKKIELDLAKRQELIIAIKKIIGQLQAISVNLENNKVTDQMLIQILAVKGGANKVCKEIISEGILKDIQNYNHGELDRALEIIFKL